MSIIGVDARTYALAHSRTYSACLSRYDWSQTPRGLLHVGLVRGRGRPASV